MRGRACDDGGTKIATATGTASGAATTLTLAAPSDGSQHILDWITASLDTAPTARASVSIAFGSTTIKTQAVYSGSGNIAHWTFPPGIECGAGNAVTITHAAVTSSTLELAAGYR